MTGTMPFAAAAMLLLSLGAATPAAEPSLPPSIAAAFAHAQIPESAVAIVVQPVGTASRRARDGTRSAVRPATSVAGDLELEANADRPMNPASTMKLVTTYSALEQLGPAFTWKTVFASAAPLDAGVLDGDLYLRGAGDPKLVFEGFWLMLRQLRARGLRTIRGDLVVDRGLFEQVPFDPGAFDGEPFRPYNVNPDALLVNFKSVTIRFLPDEQRREVRVTMEPALAGFELGPVAWGDGPCGDWRARAAPDFSRGDRLVFGGVYPGECREQTWNVAVMDHRQYVGALFRSLWGELGGALQGAVRDGAMPADARVLVEHESGSLAEAVRDINKYSNNVMARELFLSTAAEVSRQQGTAERARQVVEAFYAAKAIALPELVIENGSGLSRRERISASSMARVLQAAWASPVMPEFVSSLPLVGFDGTMRRRLNTRSVAGQAHIKTGSLADARAIAGYVLAASGRYYVVVSIINHANATRGQAGQDALLQWIYEHG